MTTEDVRNVKIPKLRFANYDMSAADDFLIAVGKNVEDSQEEIQTLWAKMKILVDEIEKLHNKQSAAV